MTIRREFTNPAQQLTTFLKLIGITANLTEMFDEAIGHEAWKSADVVEAPPKTRGVLIQRDYNDGTRLSSMVNLRSELYLEIQKENGTPWSWPGQYHLCWGYSELAHVIVYWMQELIEVRRGDKHYAITETSKPSRAGLSHTQIGRRSRSASENN